MPGASSWRDEAGEAMNVTKEQLAAFLAAEFPHNKCEIRAVGERGSVVAHRVGPTELRPGGTVSGPTLMGVADAALYVAILGEIGIVPLAVTTNLTINFLRKPDGGRDVVGRCKLIKLGRTQAVGEVWLYSEGEDEPVAHVVGTYALPPGERPPASGA
jgi:acyl-coenzyme A thioesterase PaaI-like protein